MSTRNYTIRRRCYRTTLFVALVTIPVVVSTRLHAQTGVCGGQNITLPFLDVSPGSAFFCVIAEAYFSGLTNGTGPSTYSPGDPVPREQMAAFVTRTLDQAIRRGSRRAALNQYWTPRDIAVIKSTGIAVNAGPFLPQCDGTDLWVPSTNSKTVTRVRASDGRVLGTWTGADGAFGVAAAAGKIFVTGSTVPGRLYSIEPSQPPSAVVTLSTSLGGLSQGIAFDGLNIWTANVLDAAGSVNRYNTETGVLATFTDGLNRPEGVLFDGSNIWVTDIGDATLKKLNPDGTVAMTVTLPNGPANPTFPAFDGTNIWVPASNKVYVVRASGSLSGMVLATLTGNGLSAARQAAFDGERVMVTSGGTKTVCLWRASDLTPLGFVNTFESIPIGVCSDGLSFWITFQEQFLNRPDGLGRF
jgi:hypothetical protein